MAVLYRLSRRVILVLAGLLATAFVPFFLSPAAAQYTQVNLVSSPPTHAIRADPNLVVPWGIAFGPNGPFWISDKGSGVSTLYRGLGKPIPLVVTIPPAAGSTVPGSPTGIVFNGTSDFSVTEGASSGPSLFIFDTLDGTISGWSPQVDLTHAILAVDNSASRASYTGLAIASTSSGNFIYAANFTAGVVEMYDGSFSLVNSFTDSTLPVGFAPFGIQNIGGNLYVTFANQNFSGVSGFVDVFDTSGNLIKQFAAQGTLNSPWGLALAPDHFGQFSNDLLVGNLGDGRINAFDPSTGNFLGQLQDRHGNPITIEFLWALTFGNGHLAGQRHVLYFTAGIGLFGRLQAVHP